MEQVYEAVEQNDVQELRKLLDAEPGLAHGGSRRYDPPLHRAAREGHLEAVTLLMDRGADIDTQDGSGKTPLWWACARGHVEVVRLLLTRAADPTLRCSQGVTALMMASSPFPRPDLDTVAMIRLLLKDGRCRVNARDNKGCTALWWACAKNRPEAARVLLLEAGADRTATDWFGQTALGVAKSKGHVECVRLLEWYEGELERAYLLSKARAMVDVNESISKAPEKAEARTEAEAQSAQEAAAPVYLKDRVERGEALPVLEVVMEAGQRKRKGEGEQEGEEEGEEECGAVCEHVLRLLKGELFVELMEGVRFRRSSEPVEEESVLLKFLKGQR